MSQQYDEVLKKCRGRPKTFDRDAALDKALTLFWTHGYEGTSLSDLVAATGAKAPTLYAEFENKEGLFRAAMERYIERFSAERNAALQDESKSVAEAIEGWFRATAACFTNCDTPAGCFFICTSTALSSSSSEIAHMLRQQHDAQQQTLLDFLTARQQRGDIPAQVDILSLARYLACMLQGMSVRAREGAPKADLDNIIDTLMAMWPALTGQCMKQR
ncbi:MAG: TetR/AcrR family transcriptional regulator [Pantoea sp.]|jgi:AcrR family transcriptional regulator|uniref:TetR/AcrR family transcriptional regulator n=1 Tax=Pantoea TaxID=53335 RepID=UPI0006618951|nr:MULTISPECIES: TetR/AcrR family transcriptional regulator [Pantoea]MBS6434939.1 TetR/AcrR family transcriptional regulator [Pantoea sp.]MDU2728509.1 TetR/AcrR family transcriptional regulator [Pantoea sp.]MDU6077094.1 TetR/AcrR family transcriptional regulator [Pantoea sp.]MDU7837579.1 TetR/AcrR family transcriptional regulator [Pantoea sp.]HAB23286.1 TetR/AcrR family transcriptional regulator [Pantoea sp.]